MSIARLAEGARSSLSRGLEALQGAGNPPQLMAVAQPLAQALRVLVDIEAAPNRASGAAAEPALAALREGLRLIQLPEIAGVPAAERSMAAIAEALGRVLELSRELEKGNAGATGPEAVPVVTFGVKPAAPVAAAPVPGRKSDAAAAGQQPLRSIEAALGAHSATNFYKGLASGDIVTSGGLFVATYQLPPVGEKLLLKVSMPGGYSFEATGVVAWTRDVSLSTTAPGSSPGFGAQISEISDEGRGLIQRYVRNREPLFHDDI